MRLSPSSFCLGAYLLFASANVFAQPSTQDSPFKSGPGATDPSLGSKEKYELAGISVVGKKTSICLYDTEKKSNRWLSVGEKSGPLEIVSCDPKADEAVIRLSGQTKTLKLRKAATSAAMAVPGANSSTGSDAIATPTPPPAEVAPAGLTEQQVQEREARMLVSDLLEIGMQQRKAYEEKKASDDAKKAATPTPAPAQK